MSLDVEVKPMVVDRPRRQDICRGPGLPSDGEILRESEYKHKQLFDRKDVVKKGNPG